MLASTAVKATSVQSLCLVKSTYETNDVGTSAACITW